MGRTGSLVGSEVQVKGAGEVGKPMGVEVGGGAAFGGNRDYVHGWVGRLVRQFM